MFSQTKFKEKFKFLHVFTIWYVQAINIIQVLPATLIDVSVNNLVSRNERDMVEARKDYYENAKKLNAGNRNENLLKTGQFVGMNHLFTIFASIYFFFSWIHFSRNGRPPFVHPVILTLVLGLWAGPLLWLECSGICVKYKLYQLYHCIGE